MKSFFLVFRQALRRKMILGLLALAMLELVGGGGLLLLTPLCTYATSKCSLSADTASYHVATTNYNPQVPVQSHRIPDVNQVFPAQRLHIPKSHVSAPTEAKRIDPTPKPTVTPVPTPTQIIGGSSVAAMIQQVFWSYAQGALHVATCESGLNPNAYNPTSIGGSHAVGVFQILYPSTWMGTPEAASSPYNAMANILAAHSIFVRDGYSWREWSCQP